MENGNESLWYIPGVCSGLTKREYFAAMAMQGILANEQLRYSLCRPGRSGIQIYALQQADALLQELDQNKPSTSQ
ncbi:MAG: hypothetical protein IPI90_14155 [Saprospiraceae bacterium]|nr:hypothetical protein [Candidatus Vicinibacter affinis]